MRPFFFPATALIAALAVPACQINDPGGVAPGAVNRCQTSADCAEGVCDTVLHQCVATARTAVFFVATPTAGISSTAFPTVTPVQTLRSGDTVDLDIRAPHTVYGEVLAAAPGVPVDPTHPDLMADGVAIPATVQFLRSGMVPGMGVQVAASAVLSAPINHDSMGYSYAALLLDGTYDVVVSPSPELASTVPPWFEHGFDVRADVPVQRYDLRYPADYSTWSGVVTDMSGQALPGLTVQAVDLTTGTDIQVSTVDTTDDGTHAGRAPGAFAIRIAPGATDTWTLRVSSAAGPHAVLTVEVPRIVLDRSGYPARDLHLALPITASQLPPVGTAVRPGGGTTGGDSGSIRCASCVDVRAAVEGHSTSGADVPVRGADVQLHANLPTPGLDPKVRAWFEAHAETAADGSFSASLVAGDYDVLISPQDGDFGNAIRHAFRVRSDVGQQAGQIFTLDPRLPLEGRVLTPAGDAMRGAQVTAVPFSAAYMHHPCLDDPDMATLAPHAASNNASTGSDGSYRLDLDPGLYRVLVQPPDGAGYPPTLSGTLCVASRVHAFDVTLDAPVAVHGTVHDAARHAVPGATVDALIRVSQPGATGVVVRVARSTATAAGTYSILLPNDTSLSP